MDESSLLRMSWKGFITQDERTPVWVIRMPAQNPVRAHQHGFGELVIVMGGTGIHFSEGYRHRVSTGDVFVIDGMRTHGYEDTEELDLINVVYDHRRLRLPLEHIRDEPGYHLLFTIEPSYRRRGELTARLRLTPRDLATAEIVAGRMLKECRERRPGYAFSLVGQFMELVTHLSRCCAGPQNRSLESLRRIGDALSHMEKHYADPISLEQVCEVAHMSRNTLAAHFQKAVGCPPITYLIRLRVLRAADMLRTSGMSVTEIAYSVGFSDSNYFTRQFRKIMGMPPAEFRKRSSLGGDVPGSPSVNHSK